MNMSGHVLVVPDTSATCLKTPSRSRLSLRCRLLIPAVAVQADHVIGRMGVTVHTGPFAQQGTHVLPPPAKLGVAGRLAAILELTTQTQPPQALSAAGRITGSAYALRSVLRAAQQQVTSCSGVPTAGGGGGARPSHRLLALRACTLSAGNASSRSPAAQAAPRKDCKAPEPSHRLLALRPCHRLRLLLFQLRHHMLAALHHIGLLERVQLVQRQPQLHATHP